MSHFSHRALIQSKELSISIKEAQVIIFRKVDKAYIYRLPRLLSKCIRALGYDNGSASVTSTGTAVVAAITPNAYDAEKVKGFTYTLPWYTVTAHIFRTFTPDGTLYREHVSPTWETTEQISAIIKQRNNLIKQTPARNVRVHDKGGRCHVISFVVVHFHVSGGQGFKPWITGINNQKLKANLSVLCASLSLRGLLSEYNPDEYSPEEVFAEFCEKEQLTIVDDEWKLLCPDLSIVA